jgi:hypothetical protein
VIRAISIRAMVHTAASKRASPSARRAEVSSALRTR